MMQAANDQQIKILLLRVLLMFGTLHILCAHPVIIVGGCFHGPWFLIMTAITCQAVFVSGDSLSAELRKSEFVILLEPDNTRLGPLRGTG